MSQQQDRGEARRAKLQAVQAEQERSTARRRNTTVTFAVVGAFLVIVAGVFAVTKATSGGGEPQNVQLVRSDSHRLQSAPGDKVTLVEFLDFECEACGAAFPVIEQLRKQYSGKVTFVARYFPIASHFNAERAARAVEAAAKQGKFEAMYQQMYQVQKQWAEKKVPADELFRSFARGLGLDMAAWEKAYNDPTTLARVEQDVADGKALGVEGTPTFFLNGQKLQPTSTDDIKAAIDAALAG
ncbi:DsbA family protein [Microtetraspora malaysiensis]|uniref:DsbA family protein n=1 Tax=Microtetraspora malaysiensis TaxID=161358 RepID=UPI000A031BE7|nr:thioredoxin domain-containing protein [Microtetraspora malaysiensis]